MSKSKAVPAVSESWTAMAPADLLAAARRHGLTVSVRESKLVVRGPHDAAAELVRALLERKAELMPLVAVAPEPSPAALPEPLAAESEHVTAPLTELEAILLGIETEVRRMTTDPRLIRAAMNLLNDCRDLWREGKRKTALVLARDYVRRIPKYLSER